MRQRQGHLAAMNYHHHPGYEAVPPPYAGGPPEDYWRAYTVLARSWSLSPSNPRCLVHVHEGTTHLASGERGGGPADVLVGGGGTVGGRHFSHATLTWRLLGPVRGVLAPNELVGVRETNEPRAFVDACLARGPATHYLSWRELPLCSGGRDALTSEQRKAAQVRSVSQLAAAAAAAVVVVASRARKAVVLSLSLPPEGDLSAAQDRRSP